MDFPVKLLDSDSIQAHSFQFLTNHALKRACAISGKAFSSVMENLLRNPNIASSHLFRADILWDSANDWRYESCGASWAFSQYMKPELRPRQFEHPSHIPSCQEHWKLQRTVVRRLIARNPNLDRHCVQTVKIFTKNIDVEDGGEIDSDVQSPSPCNFQETLVVYLPHITDEVEMPYYHPPVQAMAFMHVPALDTAKVGKFHDAGISENEEGANLTNDYSGAGSLSIHISPFQTSSNIACGSALPVKTMRLLQNLLSIIAKHGKNALTYIQTSNHDLIVPQKRSQDTYANLKMKYAKHFLENWVEQTDPRKDVFEDLAIAAFLIELWKDMYGQEQLEFPSFVDIACGNGLLTHVLLSEGYSGFGIDARRRKTWSIYPLSTQRQLCESVLVPQILDSELSTASTGLSHIRSLHNCVFPENTFIISNHSDELSTWTPLLSFLNQSAPFICIPCCSYNFAGARFRAPQNGVRRETIDRLSGTGSNPDLNMKSHTSSSKKITEDTPPEDENNDPQLKPAYQGTNKQLDLADRQAAEQGTLARLPRSDKSVSGLLAHSKPRASRECVVKPSSHMPDHVSNNQPSAYQSLVRYIISLSEVLRLHPEEELLRIPSTRNICIIGGNKFRRSTALSDSANDEASEESVRPHAQNESFRIEQLKQLVESEVQLPIEEVSKLWMGRAEQIVRKLKSCH